MIKVERLQFCLCLTLAFFRPATSLCLHEHPFDIEHIVKRLSSNTATHASSLWFT